jgi:chromosome segregation ATPase
VDQAIADGEGALAAAGEQVATAEALLSERDREIEARGAELALRALRIGELEQVAGRLAEVVVEREQELCRVRAELERAREQGGEGLQALMALAEDLEAVRRQARGQATRLRLRALREAAELTKRMCELVGRPGETGERLIEPLQEAIARIGAEDDEEERLAAIASSNGDAEREPGELFDGLVEVEVGPLSDFSQLVGFEDAASGIGASSEISVKRFTRGRATLAMRFKHPVELLHELEERAPFEFKVRDRRSGRIVLDVDDE